MGTFEESPEDIQSALDDGEAFYREQQAAIWHTEVRSLASSQ